MSEGRPQCRPEKLGLSHVPGARRIRLEAPVNLHHSAALRTGDKGALGAVWRPGVDRLLRDGHEDDTTDSSPVNQCKSGAGPCDGRLGKDESRAGTRAISEIVPGRVVPDHSNHRRSDGLAARHLGALDRPL